jgi:predicted HicB family RNase H-like nuclease
MDQFKNRTNYVRPQMVCALEDRSSLNSIGAQVVEGAPLTETNHLRLPRAGIEFPRKISLERWLAIGRQLSTVVTSSAWCLGDWMIYGEKTFTGRYREAIEQTSLDYQTLRNYAWVARRFPRARRRENLSFAHHAEVASMPQPEQDFWLRKAENLGWSRNKLRREVRTSLSQRSQTSAQSGETNTDEDSSGAERPRIEVQFMPAQLELCRQAAARVGISLEAWATKVLEEAARSEIRRSAWTGEPEVAQRAHMDSLGV